MKILVAGGTGFLGGALCERFLSQGASVRATYHNRPPRLAHKNLEWKCADLEQEEDCVSVVEDMELVVMCAASTSGAHEIVRRPLIHLTPNVVMNARMLEAAYIAGVPRFLFLSSAAAYPPHGDVPLTEDLMFSDEPADVYYAAGWMKRYTEILCKTYATKLNPAMASVVIRPSNVYGPGDKFDWQRSHVTAAMIRRVVERQDPITIWGDGSARRDLIYIDDFVDGVCKALESARGHLTVNIAAGETRSVIEILKTAMEIDNSHDAEIKCDLTRPQTVDVLTLDTHYAQKAIGFSAQVSFREGIRRTIDWYRKNQ